LSYANKALTIHAHIFTWSLPSVTVVIIIILASSGLIETEGTAESDLTDEKTNIFAAIGVRAPKRKKVGVDRNGNVRPVWNVT